MDVGFLFSFSAGLVSVVSPCVLPLIPIVVGHSILNHKNNDIFAFIIGFYILFAVLTVSTAIFTVAINHYIYYFRLIASILIIVLGVFFVVNRNIFNYSYQPNPKNETAGSFLMGILTSVAWSPCYGPYMVAVAAYSATTGNWIYSTENMLLFAVGFSLSLLAIAFLASKLPFNRIIKYSEEIRIFSGIIIIIAGFYLLSGYLRW